MRFSPVGRVCSFCGLVGEEGTRFAGGFGAMMCVDCVEAYHHMFADPEREQAARRPPWESKSDAEMLDSLRLMLRSQEQAAEFLVDWVALIRERGVSWAAIGKALGISRQAAWERFSPALKRLAEPDEVRRDRTGS